MTPPALTLQNHQILTILNLPEFRRRLKQTPLRWGGRLSKALSAQILEMYHKRCMILLNEPSPEHLKMAVDFVSEAIADGVLAEPATSDNGGSIVAQLQNEDAP